LIEGNKKTCNYILNSNFLPFIRGQLRYHRQAISKLLRVLVAYSEIGDDMQALAQWVHLLKPVTEENIED